MPNAAPPAAGAKPSSPAPRSGIVTLTTDIGWSYAAQMKAVLLQRAPTCRIVDISHDVPPHSVLDGAFLLRTTGVHFPPGTVHLGIVDPGVGGPRQPLILECADGSLLVGPDNGVLMPLANALGNPKAYRIHAEKVARPRRTSATFDGRDLFAPVAALLVNGTPAAEVGELTSAIPYRLPVPHLVEGVADLVALHIDPFGNVITNLLFDDVLSKFSPLGGHVLLHIGSDRIPIKVVKAYVELAEGELGILASSSGLAEISKNQERADHQLRVRPGSRLRIGRAAPTT